MFLWVYTQISVSMGTRETKKNKNKNSNWHKRTVSMDRENRLDGMCCLSVSGEKIELFGKIYSFDLIRKKE